MALTADDKAWIADQIAAVMKTKVPVGDSEWQAGTAIGYAARTAFEVKRDMPTAQENAAAVVAALPSGA